MSLDRLVAYFASANSQEEIFAYLPHIPGLNPYLIRVGDEIDGSVSRRRDRLELVRAFGQQDSRDLSSR